MDYLINSVSVFEENWIRVLVTIQTKSLVFVLLIYKGTLEYASITKKSPFLRVWLLGDGHRSQKRRSVIQLVVSCSPSGWFFLCLLPDWVFIPKWQKFAWSLWKWESRGGSCWWSTFQPLFRVDTEKQYYSLLAQSTVQLCHFKFRKKKKKRNQEEKGKNVKLDCHPISGFGSHFKQITMLKQRFVKIWIIV